MKKQKKKYSQFYAHILAHKYIMKKEKNSQQKKSIQLTN